MVYGWILLMMKTEVQMQKTPVVNWWCLTWNKYHSHSPEWCHLSSRRQPHTWKQVFVMKSSLIDNLEKDRFKQQHLLSRPGSAMSWLWLVGGPCSNCHQQYGKNYSEHQHTLYWNLSNFVAKTRVFTCWPASSEKERSVSDIHLKEENCEKGWGARVRRRKKRERIGSLERVKRAQRKIEGGESEGGRERW